MKSVFKYQDLQDGPRTERVKIFLMAVYIGIQMKQKELTKTFMMISNWIKTFCLHGLYKNNSALVKVSGSNNSLGNYSWDTTPLWRRYTLYLTIDQWVDFCVFSAGNSRHSV